MGVRCKTFVVSTTLKGKGHDSGTENSILLSSNHSKTDSSTPVKGCQNRQEKTDPSCDASTIPGPSNYTNERSYDVKSSADNSTEEILHERGKKKKTHGEKLATMSVCFNSVW